MTSGIRRLPSLGESRQSQRLDGLARGLLQHRGSVWREPRADASLFTPPALG
jgi:hypothetical protein